MASETVDATETKSPTRSRLGDYELLEELGRGGMGVVYKARQISLNRLVALKVLPTFASLDATTLDRFRREAGATSRLQHPGIVPVYGYGEHEGTYYFAMGLVEGLSLAELLAELAADISVSRPERLRESLAVEADRAGFCTQSVPIAGDGPGNDYVRSCAALIAEVANALATAHMAQIVHRDLKPSNIMIQPTGRPVLVDFGLARDALSSGLTITREAIGTPAYMAPEQAKLDCEVDTRADIYSLGATLYEMLTLRPPFDGADPAEIMRQIADREPTPILRLNSAVPVDLQTIVQKCMAKDPVRRYPAIEALETDLRSFLLGRPIMAVRPGLARRVGTTMRRLRRGALVAMSTVLVMGVAFAIWSLATLYKTLDRGEAALQVAREALVEKNNLGRALEFYGRAQVLVGEPEVVSLHRQRHVREAFDRHYPHRLDFLREALAALEPAERTPLADLVARLEGRGRFRLARSTSEELRSTVVELRALRDGNLDVEWQPLPLGRQLTAGEYLVRVTRPGHPARVQSIRVDRDERTDIDARVIEQGTIPSGMVPVTDVDRDAWFAVARTELSRREYARMLENLADPQLREAMEPLGFWDRRDADPELPVRGLSYFQARAAAAHLGAHLPSLREFHLAASGGLTGLRFPWGSAILPGSVVADAGRRQGPEPVTAGTLGVSPLGVLQVFGNVGEILAASLDGPYLMAGGHYHTVAPESFRLDDQSSFVTPLRSGEIRSRYAGMRVNRFVAQPADEAARKQAADAQAQLHRARSSLAREWRVRDDGRIDYALTLTGFRGESGNRGLRFVTTGFLQTSKNRVLDGHGRGIRAEFRPGPFREVGRVVVHTTDLTAGQRTRWRIESELTPTTGLQLLGDSYQMWVPLKTTAGLATFHRIELPAGSRIESIEPPPDLEWRESDRTNVAWVLPSDQPGQLRLGRVTFRVDGMLTKAWPARGQAVAFARRFFDALSGGDRETLQKQLDPAYREDPSGLGFAARTSTDETMRPSVSLLRFLDVTAVGQTVTVDLVADWTSSEWGGEPQTLRNWPLRLQMLRKDESFRIVRLLARNSVDAGRIDENGSYINDRLQITIAAMGGALLKTLGTELTEMQVSCLRPVDPNVRVLVLGLYLDDDEDEASARARLAAGVGKWLIEDDGQRGSLGPPRAKIEGSRGDAMIRTGDRWTRERWIHVERGRRWFVFKFLSNGATRAQADARFDASRGWFDEVSAGVVIR